MRGMERSLRWYDATGGPMTFFKADGLSSNGLKYRDKLVWPLGWFGLHVVALSVANLFWGVIEAHEGPW